MAGRNGRLAVLAGAVGLVLVAAGAVTGPNHCCGPDVLQGHRADLPGQVPGVPSAELDRADVAHHLRGSASVGPRDQGARRAAPDAALAHRPERRRQQFKNDMSLSQKQIDTIVAWVDAGAPQGDPKDLPAPQADRSPTTNGRACGTASASPTSSIAVDRIQDAGVGPGRLVPADAGPPDHRAALGEDGRDSSDQPEGPQDRAPLDRLPGAEPTIRTPSTPGPPTARRRRRRARTW